MSTPGKHSLFGEHTPSNAMGNYLFPTQISSCSDPAPGPPGWLLLQIVLVNVQKTRVLLSHKLQLTGPFTIISARRIRRCASALRFYTFSSCSLFSSRSCWSRCSWVPLRRGAVPFVYARFPNAIFRCFKTQYHHCSYAGLSRRDLQERCQTRSASVQ